MCGVLGCFGQDALNETEILLFRNLINESVIRGMHAYGIAVDNGEGWEITKSFSLEEVTAKVGGNNVIAHTRYSTSGDWRDIENNQPVISGNDFLVFNGVIRMSTKKEYEMEFGEQFETDNDGEIMLSVLRQGKDPVEILKQREVSYAGIQFVNSSVTYFRNKNRPLWELKDERRLWIASTKDIFKRAGFELQPIEVEPMKPCSVWWLNG